MTAPWTAAKHPRAQGGRFGQSAAQAAAGHPTAQVMVAILNAKAPPRATKTRAPRRARSLMRRRHR